MSTTMTSAAGAQAAGGSFGTSSTDKLRAYELLSSYQNRNNTAKQKREQQLQRWQEIEEMESRQQQQQQQQADTALYSRSRTNKSAIKVCFSPITLFLSACAQNDIDECERLLKLSELQKAGGVNVTNCDGLTALHQACIDDNEQMVRWLLSKKANINCKDNEGWTSLHASASCGNYNIVKILISHPQCDIFALNCDNELACDVCESKDCETIIRDRMNELMGCGKSASNNNVGHRKPTVRFPSSEDGAEDEEDDEEENEVFRELRQSELKSIETDVTRWIDAASTIDIKSEFERTRDKLSGATIMHVCAAKGYNEILTKMLTKFGTSINLDSFRDCDGFTALHAAAFWKQPETFETLLKFGANPELPTAKTSENIISTSVRELCKNDPKFIQLIEVSKEKEAKESETQRKIFAKRQRENRRSTQGVKKEDLEKALKIMEISKNATDSSEKDFKSIMNSLETASTTSNDSKASTDQEDEETMVTATSATSTMAGRRGPNTMTTDTSDAKLVRQASNESDSNCWTIKLPSKPAANNATMTEMETDDIPPPPPPNVTTTAMIPSSPPIETPMVTTPTSSGDPVVPSVTMTITSATPAEYARRRRIKRRATGIEDESGLALSPDVKPENTNPLSDAAVHASFDVVLNVPTPSTRPSRIITTNRPISNASSTTSLNSKNSYVDASESGATSGAASMASSVSSLDRVGDGDGYRNGYRLKTTDTPSNHQVSRLQNNVSLTPESELKKVASSLEAGGVASEEIDYKKLCKQLLKENDMLRKRIGELEEAEKKREQEFGREKRALQRTISEQEEELKVLNDTKTDNAKLKDENAALIRVISKLSK